MYTSQQPCDVEVIEACLRESARHNLIRSLEIGVFGGDTARGVKDWCDRNQFQLEYWGIDNGSHPHFKPLSGLPVPPQTPFSGANMIVGDSVEVFHRVPGEFSVILVDGCHCLNHVVLDTLHYGPKVRVGGFLLFHDTSPEIQQTMMEQHGPDIPEFYNSVLAGLALIGFPTPQWELYMERYQPGAKWGGVKAFKKLV